MVDWVTLIITLAVVFVVIYVTSFVNFKKKISLKGKHVIITGGSTGMGKSMAIQCIKEGANVTILARTESNLNQTLDEMLQWTEEGVQSAKAMCCDVTDPVALSSCITLAGRPDILICCAGLSIPGYFLDQPLSDHEKTMKVDYFGTLYAVKAALPLMIPHGGKIVMVASTLAVAGVVGFSSYSPAKYAVKGLAEVLRTELAPYNIDISIAYPPDTDTPGYAREMLTKPFDSAEISAMSTKYSADEVASYMIEGIKSGSYHIAPEFFCKVFVALSNSYCHRQYGTLEILFLPILAVLGIAARLLNDYIVRKHFPSRPKLPLHKIS
eukprot:TRINITY_DN5229_c0_g1_i1.p1 TRINITY_DN5229_c0_g1~~TRINITY_DN5229_c0_g1_i1.p1  ORF type:complete len:325 (-),score=75.16 TRINITY_DN5229_c0_g1_i1:63-1037(-)